MKCLQNDTVSMTDWASLCCFVKFHLEIVATVKERRARLDRIIHIVRGIYPDGIEFQTADA